MNVAQIESFKMEGPQPLIREIPRGAEYPVHALGALREAVEAVADKTQAPVAIAGQSALSVASLAVQGLADVETLGGYAPASLFCLTIARSGERKSGCDKLLMAGLREHESQQSQNFTEQAAKASAAIRMWEAKESRLIRDTSGNAPKALEAAADLNALPPCPEMPLSPNRTATDPTFEGLAKLYESGHPALGLFTDEGGAFFGGHAMNSDNRLKTCAGLSGLWDGSPINRTRAGDGASTLWGRRLASHMMAQPIAVRPLLADPVASGQGFLARFLITEPPSNIGYRTRLGYDLKSDAALSWFAEKLAELLATDMPLKEGTRNQLEPARLALSTDAKALLQQYYGATETAQRPGGDLHQITPYASKSAEQAARIAAVLTLWEKPGAASVTAETMADAITLAQFYLSEALRLADGAVISEKSEQAEILRCWLIENWKDDEIIPGDVARYGPASLRETAKAIEVLKDLEKHGWVAALPSGSVVKGSARKLAFRIIQGEEG